ncbi:hypothetical protein Y046_3805 [Burkholderia pseudomallei MSHR2990]|nr:hypothetical protein Y046_3805 [Burkholderia pseudomallei MSHR2990]
MRASRRRLPQGPPFAVQQRIAVLVAPRALEENVLAIMPFAAKALPLEQPLRAHVERVHRRDDAVLAEIGEQQLDHPRHRFEREALPLRGDVERHAQLGLASLVEEMHRDVADQRAVCLVLGSDLEPRAVGVEPERLLLGEERFRVGVRVRRPALVARDVGMVPVRGERGQIAALERPQHEARGGNGKSGHAGSFMAEIEMRVGQREGAHHCACDAAAGANAGANGRTIARTASTVRLIASSSIM